MLETEPTTAIILRAYPSRDADLVLRILTLDRGKRSALARGARKQNKRFPSSIDVFDRGIFRLAPGRGSLPVVEAFSALEPYQGLRDSLAKISVGSLLCEAYDLLTPEENHPEPEAFACLDQSLRHLDSLQQTTEILRSAYHAIALLLMRSGFLAEDQLGPPSAKNFATLLDTIEHSAERQLLSKASALDLVSELRNRPRAVGE